MAHIKDVKISNDTYLIEPAVYAATAGTASAITAAVSNFALDTGVVVTLKITTTNAADATLNVNSTGAKTLKYSNANLVASVLKVNRFYSFVYDGTYWQLIGELDTNTWRSISDDVNSDSSNVSASSKAVKTAYDLADGKVSKSGDTMTGSLIASASENSISNIKYYSHSSYAGKTYIGWIKILQINLNDANHFGNRTYDLYISRRFSSPPSEVYNIRVTIGWSTVNIIQLGGSANTKIIEKFRVVCDNTNHKAFFEFFVNTSYTTYQNAVDIRITEYFPSTSNPTLLSEVQIEEESAFANKWEIELAGNKIVGNINGTATNVTGTVAVEHGGTGATTAADARTNLGLGTMATETAANYLKLSGGTMTGVFTAKGSQYDDSITSSTSHAINMNNSNIIGLNAIYTADASDGAAEGINFYRDATHFDTLWMSGGDLLFVPNRALGTNTTKANSQKVGRFTANPTSGQVVITDGTTGGMKSSGYTIAKSVPSNAVFTDTNTKVNYTLATTTKSYLMASSDEPTSTTTAREAKGDTGVYLTTTAGELSSVRHSFNISGDEKAYLNFNSADSSLDLIFI